MYADGCQGTQPPSLQCVPVWHHWSESPVRGPLFGATHHSGGWMVPSGHSLTSSERCRLRGCCSNCASIRQAVGKSLTQLKVDACRQQKGDEATSSLLAHTGAFYRNARGVEAARRHYRKLQGIWSTEMRPTERSVSESLPSWNLNPTTSSARVPRLPSLQIFQGHPIMGNDTAELPTGY